MQYIKQHHFILKVVQINRSFDCWRNFLNDYIVYTNTESLNHLCRLNTESLNHLCRLITESLNHLCRLNTESLNHLCRLNTESLNHLCRPNTESLNHLCRLFSLVQYHGNYPYNTTITAYFGEKKYWIHPFRLSNESIICFKSSVEHIMEVFFLGRSAIAMHFLLFWSHKVQLI